MKKYLLLTTLFTTVSIAHPLTPAVGCNHRLGIQGALATGGVLGLGVVDFTESTELGLTISGSRNNASDQTNNFTPVLFGGLRYLLKDQTYFAWGVDIANTFGTSNGRHLDADYQIGPYISIEQMLTHHFMLAGWILPYQFSYEKLQSQPSISTHSFFSTGGVAINYLF